MNNTALRAELLSASGTCLATTEAERRPQSVTSHKESVAYGNHPYDITHMVFANEEHEKFYYQKLKQARHQDCYHKALIHDNRKLRSMLSIVYILGISGDTRKHFSRIYDMKTGRIKTGCLYEGWQTSGSAKVVRLAFNFYTDGTPSIDDYKRGDEQVSECREYSISDIFCCGYAMYFWEGIRLRYPEYCRKQKSVEEILAEMKERKNAENSIDGNKE